jgi:hypothetical protein
MKEWDKVLATRVARSYGVGRERSLVYLIVGGIDGVALSHDGNAFLRVELAMNSEEAKIVLSGILTIQFATESSLLCRVGWTTLEDHCATQGREETHSSSPSREPLGSHLVHPSVVSLLDHHRSLETDESHGPGMNI